MKKIILLVGPKHSGKTRSGLALREALERRLGNEDGAANTAVFADLDALVEAQNGKTPRELFRESAALFREAEAAALKSILQAEFVPPAVLVPPASGADLLVLAAGGGLCDNAAALRLLEEARQPFRRPPEIIMVNLAISAESAWRRIQRSGSLPPFLQSADPQKTHHDLHERRSAQYRSLSDMTINVEGKTTETIAEEIICKSGFLVSSQD
jgi:shikimate kinase